MNRRKRLKLNFGRLALTFLLLCLIVYTCYHALWSSSGSLLTTPARTVSETHLIGGEAWLFRDETLLTSSQKGLVNSVATSGTKVGKNSILTQVWSGDGSADTAEKQMRLDQLNRVIAVLEEGLSAEGTPLSRAEGYRDRAMETLGRMQLAIRSGDWSSLSRMETELLTELNRYGALTGDAEELKEALSRATAERDALLTGEVEELKNEVSSAYYYDMTQVDGYETMFTEEALQTLTAESFETLKQADAAEQNGFVVGKLCYGYSWSVAVEFADSCRDLLQEGAVYSVRFPENDGIVLEMTCQRLLESAEGGTVAVLRSDVTPLDFQYLRFQKAEITVGGVEGIYIPRQSYVSQNGTDGVYVFEDSTVRFRRISVIYEGDGYLIAALQDAEPENPTAYLGLNDLMITSGKKLYDGKVYS